MDPANLNTIKDENDTYTFNEEIHDDETVYRSRPQLPKPGTFLRNLQYFMSGLDNGTIDVDPEYQREVVWTVDRMSGLINSLMENFYIPPIILSKKTTESKDGAKQLYVCVDGKQRLSSVRQFIQGTIPCADHRGEKWYFVNDNRGYHRKNLLSEATKKEFLNKELVSFEYTGLSSEQEEDLFSRVQMGMQLTVAEKLRASTGPWQELARCYVEDFPVIYNLLKDVARARDFHMTLSCFSQILEVQDALEHDRSPSLKTTYNNVPKLIQNSEAVSDTIKSHLAHVWNTFEKLIRLDPITFDNADKHLKRVHTFAPIEMIAVTVMISLYSETRSNEVLLEYVRHLRIALRESFEDLRNNPQTWRFIWLWLVSLRHDKHAATSLRSPGVSSPAIPQSDNSVAGTGDGPSSKKRRIAPKTSQVQQDPTSQRGPRKILPLRVTSTHSPRPVMPPASVGETKPPAQGTQPYTPLEARQNRISELNSYRAPVAPMGTVAPFAAMGSPFHPPIPPPRPKSASSGTRRPILATKPAAENVFRRVSLPENKNDTRLNSSKKPATSLPQLDGTVEIIDITGEDSGEERAEQKLAAGHASLTSFRPKTSAEPQPSATASKTGGEGQEQDKGLLNRMPAESGDDSKATNGVNGYPRPQRRLIPQTHSLY